MSNEMVKMNTIETMQSMAKMPARRKVNTIFGAIISKGGIKRTSLARDYDLEELEQDIPGLKFLLSDKPFSLGTDMMASSLIEEGHLPHTDGDQIQLMLDALHMKSKSLLYSYDKEIEKEGEVLKQWEAEDREREATEGQGIIFPGDVICDPFSESETVAAT